jgi:hypothetical protein
MKSFYKILPSAFILIFFVFAGMNTVNAQNTSSEKQTKETVIKNLIDSKNYVFTAKYVQPISGPIRH